MELLEYQGHCYINIHRHHSCQHFNSRHFFGNIRHNSLSLAISGVCVQFLGYQGHHLHLTKIGLIYCQFFCKYFVLLFLQLKLTFSLVSLVSSFTAPSMPATFAGPTFLLDFAWKFVLPPSLMLLKTFCHLHFFVENILGFLALVFLSFFWPVFQRSLSSGIAFTLIQILSIDFTSNDGSSSCPGSLHSFLQTHQVVNKALIV